MSEVLKLDNNTVVNYFGKRELQNESYIDPKQKKQKTQKTDKFIWCLLVELYIHIGKVQT